VDFSYVAYTADRRLVKGRLSALNEESANELLSYGGYNVVSLKSVVPLLNKRSCYRASPGLSPRRSSFSRGSSPCSSSRARI
jgi:hypothetical protein